MMDISNFIPVIRAIVILIAGYFITRLLTSSILKLVGKHLSKQQQGLLRRILFYGLLVVVIISALHEMGFKLSVLLGAAGILSVAIGFASQTSASNLISGLFLLAERPFVVGDVIRVGSTTGEVLAIDLLSAKLRTFDNLYVRIPNETMLKSEVTTLTRFPIRRLDVPVGVAYKENTEKVRELLLAIAHQNPLCLDEPAPLFMFLGFGDSAQNLQLSVWVRRENFLEMKNTIHYEIKKTLDAHGVEIPFPHVSLYAGSETQAFPVQIVADTQEKRRDAF
jgi:small-conductance mechanosensitive channel